MTTFSWTGNMFFFEPCQFFLFKYLINLSLRLCEIHDLRQKWFQTGMINFVIYRRKWWCFENFQNITSDHKSQNALASSHDFLLLYTPQNYSIAVFP